MSRESFSSNVKNELAGRLAPDKTSRMAELAALICTCGKVETQPWRLTLASEHEEILAKIRTGLEKVFGIRCRQTDRNSMEIERAEDTFIYGNAKNIVCYEQVGGSPIEEGIHYEVLSPYWRLGSLLMNKGVAK